VHLNDQQLIDLGENERSHISACSVCRQRLEVLKELRTGLQNIDIPEPVQSLEDGWQALKLAQQFHQKELTIVQQNKNAKLWKFSSLSLAASILLVIVSVGHNYTFSPRGEHETQLALLIEQNNLLQQQVVALQNDKKTAVDDYGQLRYQLTTLDQQIQQVYTDIAPTEQKLALWLKRQKTIELWLAKKPTTRAIKI
jgi:hypothetical protein